MTEAPDPDLNVPKQLGLFPLPNAVLFPGTLLPLHVFEPRFRELVDDAIEGNGWLAVPRLEPGFEHDYYGSPPVYPVCGAGQISRHVRLPDGRYNILIQGVSRVRLLSEVRSAPYRVASCEELPDSDTVPDAVAAQMKLELLSLLVRLVPHVSEGGDALVRAVQQAKTPGEGANCVASAFIEDADKRQRLLEDVDPLNRMATVGEHLRQLITLVSGEQFESTLN